MQEGGQLRDSFSNANAGQAWVSGGFSDPTTQYFTFDGSGKLKPWGYTQLSLMQLFRMVNGVLPGTFNVTPTSLGAIYTLRWDIPVVLSVGLGYLTVGPSDSFIATTPSTLEVALWEYDSVNNLFWDVCCRGRFESQLWPRDLSSSLGGASRVYRNMFERMEGAKVPPSSVDVYMDFLSFKVPGGWGGLPTQSPYVNLTEGNSSTVVYGAHAGMSVNWPSGLPSGRFSPSSDVELAETVTIGRHFPTVSDCYGAGIRVPAYIGSGFDGMPGFVDALTAARTLSQLDWDVQFAGQICRIVRGNNWAWPLTSCQPLA